MHNITNIGQVQFPQPGRFWRAWLSRSRYRGRWRDVVDRAAITLTLSTGEFDRVAMHAVRRLASTSSFSPS